MNALPKTPHGEAPNASLQIPPRVIAATLPEPEFIRLPQAGRPCAYTGLTRSFLNTLILPSPANEHRPPVKSFVIRRKGARTGVRLIDYESLRAFIHAHAESGNPDMERRPA